MKLLVYEWRKLAQFQALWGFLLLCLAFNCLLLYENDYCRQPFNKAGEAAAVLGQRVDEAFLRGMESFPQTEYGEDFLSAVREMTDIFADYDLCALSDFYQKTVKGDVLAQRLLVRKYALLEGRIDRLHETGAAMDLYAGPVTQRAHQFLCGTLLRAVAAEAGIAGMLSMLYLLGYELQQRTQAMACASRTGRALYRWKVLAGVLAAVCLYLLLLTVTLAAYCSLWDYSGIWSASVSSQFNYLTDMLIRRPFFTWADFTVGGYLAAVSALGAALTAAFSLLAALLGTLVRNVYLAAMAVMVFCLGALVVQSVLAEAGLWSISFALSFQPISAWMAMSGWFTELGLSACVPWQECAAVGASLLVFGGGTALALRRFGRKDVVK